jgi:alkanesulfonate monooxygenase SsuD/methylene tetrahydromethanopterin reductase-like flavin-dependent oxidoreductase (luciferase family)
VPAIRLGANFWNQHTTWPAMLEAGIRADRLGYDTLWTWDHLYPIVGDSSGACFEGWLTIAAWAARTERIRIGLLVGANPYREPTLVAKMATSLDHISAGRAILGIGAAWNDEEADAFGFTFGSGAPERLRWLGEALPLMRGMLDGREPTALGPRYRARRTRNLPAPVQRHLPILIGGMGERVTLRLVARYGDMCNLGGGDIERIRARENVLVSHCEAIGRDPAEIERTASVGTIFIRDDPAEAERVCRRVFDLNRADEPWYPHHGTPEQIAEQLAPFLELGYRHLIANFPAPYDEESVSRLATEVRSLLEGGVTREPGQPPAPHPVPQRVV